MSRTDDDIARRAYELFLSRGAQHGGDVDDWLEAERQLTKETAPAPPTQRPFLSSARAPKAGVRRRR